MVDSGTCVGCAVLARLVISYLIPCGCCDWQLVCTRTGLKPGYWVRPCTTILKKRKHNQMPLQWGPGHEEVVRRIFILLGHGWAVSVVWC